MNNFPEDEGHNANRMRIKGPSGMAGADPRSENEPLIVGTGMSR